MSVVPAVPASRQATAAAVAVAVLMAGVLPAASGTVPATTSTGAPWRVIGRAAVGFDTYSQRYYPGDTDTTEVISELAATVGAELERRPAAGWRWRLRPEVSAGTERTRERLEVAQSVRLADGSVPWRALLQAEAVQYGGGSDYYLTSDSRHARLRTRWRPGAAGRLAGELRLDGEWLDYSRPSSLELDRREWRAGAALASGHDADDRWRVGLRVGRRVYPDSNAIDRDVLVLEGSYDHNAFLGTAWRLDWRSERRDVDRPDVRPSSWSHWLDTALELPLGDRFRLVADGEGEWWRYDTPLGVYTDQSRGRLALLLRGSGLAGPAWEAGVTGERLDSDTPGESYYQLGLRVGADLASEALSGTLSLEVGKRDYAAVAVQPAEPVPDPAGDLLDEPLYTDFTYLELWLTATWRLRDALSLDVLASYLPETHDREIDDQTLGMASLRLSYRF